MPANQNVTQLTQQTGSAAASSLFYAVTGGATDTGLPLSVLVNNLGLTGTPTAPTATAGTNTTQIASTAFVVASFAPLASPTFTGTPLLPTGTTAVTQTPGNNSTAIATTAFVVASFAPLASPTFTGVPLAPTATAGNSSTQIATTAFVNNIFAAAPAIGSTTPNAGSFTTLTASSGINSTAIGATTASTGKFTTLQATSTITPSTTSGIVGTTLADSAQAGSVGELITATATAVSLSNGTPANITSISLTAGDWDVWGNIHFLGAGSTTISAVNSGINTTSATLPASPLGTILSGISISAGGQVAIPMHQQRINVSTTTTVFLVGTCNFAVSTLTANGVINARRRR